MLATSSCIGLSGLLVKSVQVMEENLYELNAQQVKVRLFGVAMHSYDIIARVTCARSTVAM